MRLKLILLVVSACALDAQEVFTNETVIKLISSGVPTATVIKTILAADSEAFSFLPMDLQRLQERNVPDDVFKAMARRAKYGRNPGVAGTQSAGLPGPAAPQPPRSQAQIPRSADLDQYQGRGMWDIDFEGSATIPHSSVANTSGFVSGGLG
jgi:hypothetical protein